MTDAQKGISIAKWRKPESKKWDWPAISVSPLLSFFLSRLVFRVSRTPCSTIGSYDAGAAAFGFHAGLEGQTRLI
jgi:hypothetical protein